MNCSFRKICFKLNAYQKKQNLYQEKTEKDFEFRPQVFVDLSQGNTKTRFQ